MSRLCVPAKRPLRYLNAMEMSAHLKHHKVRRVSTSAHPWERHLDEGVPRTPGKNSVCREGYFDCFEINLQLSDRKK